MKNILSFVGVVLAGLIIYFLGAKFGGRPGGDTIQTEKDYGDPALEVYRQFTEYRAKYEFTLAKKMAIDPALKTLFKEKVRYKTLPELEVLFVSSKFKKTKSLRTNSPSRKEYDIVEERVINNNPNAPSARTKKKITHEHKVVMVRQEGAWMVSEYTDEVIPE